MAHASSTNFSARPHPSAGHRVVRRETGEPGVSSVAAGSLTLHDTKTNRAFLIDTGAEVSIVPATEQERQGALLQKELVAANGSRIRCYGERKIQLQVGSRNYEWTFLVAGREEATNRS